MSWLRRIALSIGILTLVTIALAGHYYYKGFYSPLHKRSSARSSVADAGVKRIADAEAKRINVKISAQKSWIRQQGFSDEICFLADMRLPSGKNRFFVYDLHKNVIVQAGLVAHGNGNNSFAITPQFSNVNGSNNTALGRYRIGQPYMGTFGLAYKLYGLDPTNDQAFNRNIVLHAFNAVPAAETQPYPICNSRGCPMVAPVFLKQLQTLIDRSKKPILLYIFN